MTSKRTKLQEDTHFRVLRLLQENPEMSQRELAEAVGVSVGGIHYVLNALIDKGLLKLGNFTAAEDKRRNTYVLPPSSRPERMHNTARCPIIPEQLRNAAQVSRQILERRT